VQGTEPVTPTQEAVIRSNFHRLVR